MDFQTGLLGPYCYPVTGTGGGLRQLFDAGSDQSANLGLDSYTTRVDQFPDYGLVDIGFHYKIGSLTMDTNATALQLAQMLVPPWVTVANAKYTGALEARGTFAGGLAAGLPIDSGVILSSGNIMNATGPNNLSDATTQFGTTRDSDLDSLVGGGPTLDAAVVEFDIISPTSFVLIFNYIFASEEYPEFINSYNDPVAIFVSTNFDGTKWINSIANDIALVPLTTHVPVSVNNVNGGWV